MANIRISSRQATSQVQPATNKGTRSSAPPPSRPQRQAIRATRSQSREASSTAPLPKASRAARQASIENNESSTDRNTLARGMGRPKAVGGLAPVEEVPAMNPTPDPQAEEAADMDVHRSPGGYSNISQATTAFSSLSANEDVDMDSDYILHELKPLFDTADEIIKHLSPMQASLEILAAILQFLRQPRSKWSKLHALKEQNFAIHRKRFGDSEYIRPGAVERALYRAGAAPTSPSRVRVDEIIQKADLAIFLISLASLDRENSESWNMIRRLDKHFPMPFIQSFLLPNPDSSTEIPAVGSSRLLDKTVELAIDIRTQLAIMHLTKCMEQEGFSPEEELFKIFFELADPNSTEDAHIRGWETNGLGGGGSRLPAKYQELVHERVNDIKDFFVRDAQSIEHETVDIEGLNTEFSWQDFVVHALDWIRSRNQEITALIQARGGVDKIVRTLQRQVDGLNDSPQTPHRTPNNKDASSAKSALSGSAQKASKANLPPYASMWTDVAEFNRRVSGGKSSGEKAAQNPPSTALQLVSHADENDDWRPVNVDEEMNDVEAGPSTAVPTARDRLSQVKLHLKQNKENLRRTQARGSSPAPRSFIDPQMNAQRVRWSQGSQVSGVTAPRTSQISRGKRPVLVDDEDVEVSEDEGFEQDQRTVDVQRKRMEAPTDSRRSIIVHSPKRHRFQEPPRIAEELPDSEEEEQVAAATARSQVPSSNYREVNEISKNLSRLNPPKPQNRTKWSPLEDDRLISLIQEVGCSWARIKKLDVAAGNILALRDQVALKDKARNMKFDFLKAGVRLPENFEAVPLNARQKAKLRELGVPDV